MKLPDKKIEIECIGTNCREQTVYGTDCKGQIVMRRNVIGTNCK